MIELMLAMVLLAIVAGGLFSGLTVIGRAQANAAAIDLAQAGVRAGFELLSRDLRMVGAGTTDGLISEASGAQPLLAAINVVDSATGPDRLDLVLLDPTARTTTTAPFSPGANAVAVFDASQFRVGDRIVVTDFAGARDLMVTGIGMAGGGPALSVADATNPQPRTWGAGSLVFRARVVSYSIDTPFGAGDPMLMLDPDGAGGAAAAQPLAEGIEDFQIALGFDFNGDGALTSVGTVPGDDEWVYNVAGEAPPPSLAQLRAVRLTLVARPTSALGGIRGRRPTAEDHPGAATDDAFPRRVLRSEIAVRNFNL